MPAESLQAAGKLTIADLTRFQFFHRARRQWYLAIPILLMLIFCLLGIGVVLSTGDVERIENPGSSYFIMLAFLLLYFVVPFVAARQQYAKQQYLREPMRYQFTDEHVRLEGASFSTEVKWSLVQGVYETKSSLFIYQSPQGAWILPKRFFWGDDRTLQLCRNFIVAHLANRKLFHVSEIPGNWL
jgi:YcxB-like protein